MSSHDQRFFDMFMVVIGALIVATVALIFLARFMATGTQQEWVQTLPEHREQVSARISPIGRVRLPGDGDEVPAPVVAAIEPAAAQLTGPQVYNTACLSCHGTGIAGAPRTDEAEAWTARIAQGMDTVYRHALEGFTGDAGYMPPKGGRTDLSDEEIVAAVDYMLEQTR